MSAAMKKICGSVAIAIVTGLTVEGFVSVTTGRSFLRRLPQLFGVSIDGGMPRPNDHDRVLAGAQNPGPYWLHPDPRVGITLRPDSRVGVADMVVRTDALGMRLRPGVEPPGDALRIVVVGASIPFGWRLKDEQTLAHQLERRLTEASDGSQAFVCLTVAIPRWSFRSAIHFVLDHWQDLRPDIILYMPFANDMADTFVVTASGDRKSWPDASSPHPWTPVEHLHVRRYLERLRSGAGFAALRGKQRGVQAIEADASPESSRWYDDNAASIARLARFVERRGKRFGLLLYTDSIYQGHLLCRLRATGARLLEIPLFRRVEPEFRFTGDSHPNATAVSVMALWTAESLIRAGWLPGVSQMTLPAVPGAYEGARALPRSFEEYRELCLARRELAGAVALNEVDFRTGKGLKQVYGGLSPSGYGTTGMLIMLAPAGPRLLVRLQGVDASIVSDPIEVEVRIDETTVGILVVRPGEVVERHFEIPARGADAAPTMEVHLVPRHWGVVREDGVLQLASFKPLRIASE